MHILSSVSHGVHVCTCHFVKAGNVSLGCTDAASACCAGYTPDSGGAATESAGNDVTSLILSNGCSSEFVYTGAGVPLSL